MKDKASNDASQPLAIEIQGLTKSFGNQIALRGINLKVKEEEFLTIFGPNGSGKTTLIRVLSTISKPSSGSARVAGFELGDSALEIRRRIGMVTHQTFLYDDLTAYENLKFYGRMYDAPKLEERIHEVITKFGLTSRLHDRVRTLSRGMQQRLSLARAMIHRPQVLLLDEPETGLDQNAAAMLREVIDTLSARERTVIMTTHRLEYGFNLGNHVVIMAEGRIAYESKKPPDVDSFREIYHHYTGVKQ